jgi:hypothetical protein
MRNPSRAPAKTRENSPKAIQRLRWTLLSLILELTFEGLARKLNIHGTSIAIFLLKDVIVAAMGIQVALMVRPAAIRFLWVAYLVEIILFLPNFLQTAGNDPILAVFGAKEYLLYPVVAFATFMSFETATIPEIVRFFRWLALLVIPTALVALLQLRLPATHWLNESVDGSNLDGFSAGGQLRVSSTFSFVAQYCAFIDAEVFIAMIALNNLKDMKFVWKMVYLSIVPLLIISSYVTGSRGAVLVCCLIVALAAVLSLIKLQVRSATRIVLIIGGLLLTLVAVRTLFPNAFAAYSEREQGQLIGASSEIQTRIYDSMFGWIGGISSTPFFGYGLGIMSNGSEMLSPYALQTRAYGWTETDLATTLFEGGIYLIFVWYAFRAYVIYQVFRRYLGLRGEELSVPCAFCVAFVIILGVSGTLAIQPPIAIWFWLSVGTALIIWWKSIESKSAPADGPGEMQLPAARKKIRGQSAYAEKLHGK